jgi:uncharacterized protein (DUF952 family)
MIVMPIIYHVTTAEAWNAAQQKGQYESPSLAREGFIHCSEANQVAGVLDRYFAGQTNLVKLVIDTEALTSRLVYDWSTSNEETYPHVYGPINTNAVKEVIQLN